MPAKVDNNAVLMSKCKDWKNAKTVPAKIAAKAKVIQQMKLMGMQDTDFDAVIKASSTLGVPKWPTGSTSGNR
ncbi:hypothetical protein VMCG_04271 [Cytospora schulzeri]|uniref:Uncharacterized protein n=1 Tax=Cytospora schulzeri TaxID=448051 RepID=A0A423WSK8_9PEZI|nr:hypothetical protein VMCG_04271 [Valsa malicola]